MQKQTAVETNAGPIRRAMKRSRESIDAGLAWFIDRIFLRAYRACVSYRYIVLVAVVGMLLMLQGAVASGRIGVKGFSRVESDTIVSKITMPTGTSLSTTEQVARDISLSAKELNDTLGQQEGGQVVQRVYAMLGKHMGRRGGEGDSGSHVAEVIVELMPSERRSTPSQEIVNRWRERVGSVSGALSVTFGTQTGGPGGLALQILLRGQSTDQAKAAANVLKDKLGTFAGVKDIEDDALPGKMEMKVDLKDRAYSLGLNLRMLAEQLRDAFRGNMPLKIQRGRDEIEVMVRYPEEFRRSVGDVENLRIQTPSGSEVPFREVARVTMQRGYTTLRRVGGDSVVTVSADVEDEVTSSEEILQELSASGFFRRMEQDFPGLKVDLRGQRQQIFESLDALKVWFPLALLGIYMVLATIFRSYVQPVIIMIAIPFGLMGAVLGHWLMGFDLTLLSMFGMVALTGIVVNDSLVLLDYVNGRIREGGEVFASAEEGARRRFRPILLTTVTTIAGMGPILLERSFQAQFLKPMVISIAFGLAMATMLTLIVVPCLLLIGNDIRRAMRWLWRGEWVSPEAVLAGEVEPQQDEPGPE
jgi:multidrug efflux pump subunit AcrB